MAIEIITKGDDMSSCDIFKGFKLGDARELLKLLDQPDIISFAGGIPDPALFPADEFAEAFKTALTPERQAQRDFASDASAVEVVT